MPARRAAVRWRDVQPPPSPSRFRRTLGRFATGVTVVAVADGDVRHGMTANAFTSVSLEPPLVLVCVDHRAAMHDLVLRAGTFAVTVLAADQRRDAEWFSSPRPRGHEFDDVAWKPAPVTGSPLLVDGLAYVDCELRDSHVAGDHTIVVGEVVDLDVLRDDAEPLLWWASGYQVLGPYSVPNSRSPKSPRPGTM